MYDIIIIGGGPAGLTAATYARRAGKTVLCIEKSSFGGQITWSPKVENFPSVESISGMELGDLMMAQAERQGAEFELDEVLEIIDCGAVKQVKTEFGGVFEAKAVIVATGAKPKMAGIPDEESYLGAGLCFCALCDGAFYKGRPAAVYGGGNSALQDAVLLSDLCSKVYLIHRRSTGQPVSGGIAGCFAFGEEFSLETLSLASHFRNFNRSPLWRRDDKHSEPRGLLAEMISRFHVA